MRLIAIAIYDLLQFSVFHRNHMGVCDEKADAPHWGAGLPAVGVRLLFGKKQNGAVRQNPGHL
ncbi:hypothetical protein DESC_740088 [Desulfosarcina cetonica]|nr:hypothetical protein DESC_740088 [Desulfosarcina cetonica]